MALVSVPFSPISAQVQPSEPASSAQIDALKTELIALLTQLLTQLQVQLQQVLDQQTATNQTISAISTQVNTLGSNVVGSVPTPPTPPIDVSKLVPATLGVIYKSSDPLVTHDTSGQTRNIIPVVFNDADLVHIHMSCPNAGSVGAVPDRNLDLKKSDFPNGYTFQSLNVGSCTYSMESRSSDYQNIGTLIEDQITFQ